MMPETQNEIMVREPITGQKKIDTSFLERVELSCLTSMSPEHAIGTVREYITKARELGMGAIAITDLWNVWAFPDVAKESKRLNSHIKVIYGMEVSFTGQLRIDEGMRSLLHERYISILAKNRTGLENIYSMITSSSRNTRKFTFGKWPDAIGEITISEHRGGLLIGSGNWQDGINELTVNLKDNMKELVRIAKFYDYLEVRPNHGEIDNDKYEESVRRMVRLGELAGRPVVATGNVCCSDPDDRICLDILCLDESMDIEDYTDKRYLMSTAEMLKEFAFLGKKKAEEIVVTNSCKIASIIDDMDPIPDERCQITMDDADTILMLMCIGRLNRIYPKGIPEEIKERYTKELSEIKESGTASYYIIASDLIKNSEDAGYPTGLRGCAAGSFVAFLSGITDINPLKAHYYCPVCGKYERAEDNYDIGEDLPDKNCDRCGNPMERFGYNLPCEPFIGLNGENKIYFDINVVNEYYDKAIEYLKKKYGKDRILRQGILGRMDNEEIQSKINSFCKDRNITLTEKDKKRIEEKLYSVKGKSGVNPAGIFILPKDVDINRFTPVQCYSGVNAPVTHFSYHDLEDNFTKLDLIRHYGMTMLYSLKECTGRELKYSHEHREEMLALFRNSCMSQNEYTFGILGIPEFGTEQICKIIEEAEPQSIADIIRINALSHGTDTWEDNAEELLRNGTADLGSVITTRDDIYLYLLSKGMPVKDAYEIMEYVRKGKSRRKRDGRWNSYKELMRKYDVPEWYLDSCEKIRYLFPKAHCTDATLVSLDIALYKIHYPEAFYAIYAFYYRGACREFILCDEKDSWLKAAEQSISEEEKGLIVEMIGRDIDFDESRMILKNCMKGFEHIS